MNHVHCNIIKDLLPLYIDKALSRESVELVESHLKSCSSCAALYSDMTADFPDALSEKIPEPDLHTKKAFQHIRRNLIWIGIALAVMVGCFVSNIGGAWMGGPADAGQFIATVFYILFWGLFTVMTRQYGVLAKVSFIISLVTFIGALNSLVMRLLSEGWILAALISTFASVPFYGLRLFMDWTALYAVATGISLVWLIYSAVNQRRLKKSLNTK